MIKINLKAASAATVAACLISTGAAYADGHGKQLVAKKGLCPEMIQQMVAWSQNRKAITAYALPTSRKVRACGEPGEPVTAAISTSDDLQAARKAALQACNDARGNLGRCVVVGYLRDKQN